jgi:hypothetical protein
MCEIPPHPAHLARAQTPAFWKKFFLVNALERTPMYMKKLARGLLWLCPAGLAAGAAFP